MVRMVLAGGEEVCILVWKGVQTWADCDQLEDVIGISELLSYSSLFYICKHRRMLENNWLCGTLTIFVLFWSCLTYMLGTKQLSSVWILSYLKKWTSDDWGPDKIVFLRRLMVFCFVFFSNTNVCLYQWRQLAINVAAPVVCEVVTLCIGDGPVNPHFCFCCP